MESCKHMNFEASVNVARIEDKGRFMAEIHIRCKDCGTPFQFMGLKPGPPRLIRLSRSEHGFRNLPRFKHFIRAAH